MKGIATVKGAVVAVFVLFMQLSAILIFHCVTPAYCDVDATGPAPGYSTLWTQQVSDAYYVPASLVSADGAGNVYTLVNGGKTLKKLDHSGNVLWTQQAAGSCDECGGGLYADAAGNVYVAGTTWGGVDGNTNAGSTDFFVTKYDKDGNKQWTRQRGSVDYDWASGVSADAAGNVYVAGATNGYLDGNRNNSRWDYWAGRLYDLFVCKFDKDGNWQWTRAMGTVENDTATAICTDTAGNVYITGITQESLDGNLYAGNSDIYVMKFDGGGNKLWTRQAGTSTYDSPCGITSDAAGHVYVTGITSGDLDGNTNAGYNTTDIFVMAFDGSGNKLWTRLTGAPMEDDATGVSSDAAGNVYVAGYTDGGVYNNPTVGLVIKYDKDGNKQWTMQTGSTRTVMTGVSADAFSHVYVAGTTWSVITNGELVNGFVNKLFSGAIAINGNAPYTNNALVSLTVPVIDESGVAQMEFSNSPDSGWSEWQGYAGTAPWTLPPGDGVKTVYAKFKDTLGNESTYSKSIILDVYTPASAVTAPANNAKITVSTYTITGTAADNTGGSGVQKVEVGITPSGGTTTWYQATGTTSWSFTWTLPSDGSYTIQSRATDNANNVETPGAGVSVNVNGIVLSIINPAVAVTPCTTNYNINISGSDFRSSSVTVKLYYYNVSSPSVRTLFSTQTLPVTGGVFSSTVTLDLVGVYPNYMSAGTYGIYGEASDSILCSTSSTASGTVGISTVTGAYTCSMQAKWGAPDADYDDDGLTNYEEITGAYGYVTDPGDPDTDHDGLDDGIECGVKALGANLVLGADGKLYTCIANHTSTANDQPGATPATANWKQYWGQYGAQANGAVASYWASGQSYTRGNNRIIPLAGDIIHTDPTKPDTDGGGTSDAVEIVKGTNPAAGGGADDLVVASSPQDLWSPSTFNQDPLMNTHIDITNFGNANATFDLDFYNDNGTLNKTVPVVAILAPKKSITVNPCDYGVTEGSFEVRTTSPDVKGNYEIVQMSRINTQVPDGNGFFKMSTYDNTSMNLVATAYADWSAVGWRNWVYVKNPSDSTANVNVIFYSADGTANVTLPYMLGGHQTVTIRPSAVLPSSYTHGVLMVQSTNGVPVIASMWFERGATTDQVDWNAAYVLEKGENLSTVSYNPAWAAGIVGFSCWVYVANPNNAVNSVTITFYSADGTQTYPYSFTLNPYQYIGFTPQGAGVPFGNGWYKVTSSLPHSSAALTQRAFRTGLFDWASMFSNVYAPQTVLLDAKQKGGVTIPGTGAYAGWIYVTNPDTVNTAHLTYHYYDMNGVETPAGGVPHTCGPNAMLMVSPGYTDASYSPPSEGSIVITSDIPVFGLGLIQQQDYLNPTFFDNGSYVIFW